ncbi:NAD(P)/FAD-dependent oxidoreductase [Bacillaceae bacterium SIJ1]|uniref:NAD(P)/FAD-dependent oxidoreductase n=1 Tax=Litoribacterium kuwaitense TaxID=1398745 RepID=UPI0013EC322F|nr:NAD(P)/FAD-dependent oxidoreductase [Litoribacterium kuwaitense]NGP46593.1 NAD(P)/FAD-dependent oxidoreductase [Litoribacterium kuwaitense]
MSEVYDVTIIGAGPTGLFAAFYGGMRDMKVKVIDSMPELGGQLTALYPDKYIYDVAGFPKIKASELVDNLREQMQKFDQSIILGSQVDEVTKQADGTFLIKSGEDIHLSKTVLITGGVGSFQPRKLKLECAEKYEGRCLHYHIKDLSAFRDHKVVVAGGGDSAVDWALMLEPIAKEVSIVHRRDQFRAHEHSVNQLRESSVNIMTPCDIVDIVGDPDVTEVVIKNKEGELSTLEADTLVVNYGFISSLGPIKNWGLEIEKNSIVVNTRMETNIPGIYAAGDITTYEGKIKLIATGFGEGPTAINNAFAYLNPDSKVQPKHSTSLFA